jgi:O-antigen/teichoic acid export membrane protein
MLKMMVTIGAIQFVAIIVNVVKSKILAVLLGPAGVGAVSVIDQIVQLVAYVSAISIPFAAVKYLSRSHSLDTDAFQRSYASFFRLLLGLTLVGTVVALTVLLWHPELLGSQLLTYRDLLLPALLTVPIVSLIGYCSGVLAAAQKARTAAFMAVAGAVCFTLAAYVGIRLAGVRGLYWGNLSSAVLVLLGTVVYFRVRLNLSVFQTGGGGWRQLREQPGIIAYSLILSGASFAMSLAYFIARFAVLNHQGQTEAGYLQVAIALSAAIGLVLGPANGLYLTPILNRDIPTREKLRSALAFQRRLLVIVVAIAMPIVLFPQWIVPLLYSPSFVAVSGIIFVFVAAQCISQLAGVYQALLIGLDDIKAYGAITAFGYLSLGAVSWLLAPRFGLLGVALGFLAGNALIFVLGLTRLTARYQSVMSARLAFSLVCALLALVLAGWLFGRADASNPFVIASKVVLYPLSLVGMLGFLDTGERRQLRAHTRQTGRYVARSIGLQRLIGPNPLPPGMAVVMDDLRQGDMGVGSER